MDCNVTCGKDGFLGLGVERFGFIGEILCCVVVIIFSTISSFTGCGGIWLSCWVRFLVPFRFSCRIVVEFKLIFPILLGRNEL